MNWNEALEKMKQGAKVKRLNWSGKKFIFYMPTMFYRNDGTKLNPMFDILGKDTVVTAPCVYISTKENTIGYYATTQCDMLADDWIEYKPQENETSD